MTALKKIRRAIAKLALTPLTLPELLARRIAGRDVWFRTQTEVISLIPGTLGMNIRATYYHTMLPRSPMGCLYKLGTIVTSSKAEFGERVGIGRYAMIDQATIGDDCIIGAGAQILSGKFSRGITDPKVPFGEQPGIVTRVRVGRNSWIGANAVVMADVGENCVVAAGAVVTRAFPSNKIIVGNPARAVVDTFDQRLLDGRKTKVSEVRASADSQRE